MAEARRVQEVRVFRDSPPPRRPGLWEAWSAGQLLVFALLLFGAHMFWQLLLFTVTGDAFGQVLGAALIAVVLPCAAAAWWHGETLWAAFDMRGGWWPLAIGAVAGLLAWAPAGLLAEFSARLRPPTPEYLEFLAEQLPTSPAGTVVAFAAVMVGAPVAEELIFRGMLFRLARDRWGAAGAAVLTALFFGIAHWSPWSLFGVVGLGLLLAALYHWTGSLLAPIAAHASHNAVSMGVMLASRDAIAPVSTGEADIVAAADAATGVAGADELTLVVVSTALLAALLWWLVRRVSPRPDDRG
jgi:membrane protease YdiL (CAAX protease family)